MNQVPVTEAVTRACELAAAVRTEVQRLIVGQDYVIDRLLIGLFTGGHVLIEGVPGLAKTMIVRSIASAVNAQFGRVQFTPDLLPADLIGTQIYNPATGKFSTKRGPIFANIILADEINRAPPKVQSALLEAMEERQVTIGEESLPLPVPFFVFATQNPIEQEGTYPLPEAQLDRFMLKLRITYPSETEERQILERMGTTSPQRDIEPVLSLDQVQEVQASVDSIYLDAKLKDYIISLVRLTREPGRLDESLARYVRYGASPRATIYLTIAAKAHAMLAGRQFVTPTDIKAVALDVLRHRVLLSFEAEADEVKPDELLNQMLDRLAVP